MNVSQSAQYFRMKNSQITGVGKTYLYYVHNPRTGGKYIKEKFYDQLNMQWYGKMQSIALGIKMDDHPCVYKEPVINKRKERNQVESYLYDPYFLDARSLVFTTVRNPFDRYVSAFLEAKNTYEEYSSYSFERFIEEVCNPDYEENPKFGFSFELSRKFFPYQVFNDTGYCVAQVILRKEALNDCLKKFTGAMLFPSAEELGLEGSSDFPPGRWGENRKEWCGKVNRDYRTFYNNRTVDLVSKKREKELRAFKYDFENNYTGPDYFVPMNMVYKKEEDEFGFVDYSHFANALPKQTEREKSAVNIQKV